MSEDADTTVTFVEEFLKNIVSCFVVSYGQDIDSAKAVALDVLDCFERAHVTAFGETE